MNMDDPFKPELIFRNYLFKIKEAKDQLIDVVYAAMKSEKDMRKQRDIIYQYLQYNYPERKWLVQIYNKNMKNFIDNNTYFNKTTLEYNDRYINIVDLSPSVTPFQPPINSLPFN